MAPQSNLSLRAGSDMVHQDDGTDHELDKYNIVDNRCLRTSCQRASDLTGASLSKRDSYAALTQTVQFNGHTRCEVEGELLS